MPLVSIVMPCFNHARYVGESIQSVLDQTERDLELIVVDDASSDDSRRIIERARCGDERVKPIYHDKNRGASEARNSALKVATGKYIAFCDADDLWLPTKLAAQLEALEPYPEIAVIYSDAQIINGKGEKTGRHFSDQFPVPGKGSGNLFNTLCLRNFINMPTGLVRRVCLKAENYFDPELRPVEDWWFWLKLARATPFLYIPEPLVLYRVHEQSSATTELREPNGLARNRVKVYLKILHSFSDIPPRIVSQIYYHLGVGLAKVGERKDSQRAYGRALKVNPVNWKAAARLILCTVQK